MLEAFNSFRKSTLKMEKMCNNGECYNIAAHEGYCYDCFDKIEYLNYLKYSKYAKKDPNYLKYTEYIKWCKKNGKKIEIM